MARLGPLLTDLEDIKYGPTLDELDQEEEEEKGFLARQWERVKESPGGPGAEYAERQAERERKQREAEAREAQQPVKPAAPLAEGEPTPEDLRAAREAQTQPVKPAQPLSEESAEGPPPDWQIPQTSRYFTAPGAPEPVDPRTGAPMAEDQKRLEAWREDEELRAFRKEHGLPDDWQVTAPDQPFDWEKLKSRIKKAWGWLGDHIDPSIQGLGITEKQIRDAEIRQKEYEAERQHMIDTGLMEPDPADPELAKPETQDAIAAGKAAIQKEIVDPETGERAERDLSGDKDTGFINQFTGRFDPGWRQNAANIRQAYWRTNFLLHVNFDSNQRKAVDSVFDQLARAAHPGDRQKQQAYKVRLGQEISDVWEVGSPAHELIAREQARLNVGLREDPQAVSQMFEPPQDLDKISKQSAKHISKIEKGIQEYYEKHPEYQLPSDWNKLTDRQREIKYPGIYWGENIFNNSLNSAVSIATYAGTAALTKNHALATFLSGAVLYPSFVDEVYQELERAEKDEGIKIPDEVKAQLSLWVGVPSALVEGLSERVGFGPALTKHFSQNVGKKAMIKTIVDGIKKKAAARAAFKYAARPIAWTTKEGMAGAFEEGSQQTMANLAAQAAGSERDTLEGVKQAAKVGFVMEPALAGPVAGMGAAVKEYKIRKEKKAGEAARKQVEDLLKDYEDQTAEDILMDPERAAEAATERETEFTGAEAVEAEETAEEFTEEELAAAAAAAPEIEAEVVPEAPRAPKPTERPRMGERPTAAIKRIWGVRELVGGPRVAPARTTTGYEGLPIAERPAKKRPAEIQRVKEIWAGKRPPSTGGIIEDISVPPAKTRITPTSRRQVVQNYANELGKQVGAKIRFDNVIFQDERPVGLQMTITSGPAKGARFTISDSAHKTKGQAQAFVSRIVAAYEAAMPEAEIVAPKKKPTAKTAQQEFDELVASLNDEQRAAIKDLIEWEDMPIEQRLGLARAELATLETKKALKAPPPAEKPAAPPPPAEIPPAPPAGPIPEALPMLAPGERWTSDRGAMPGEPSLFLDAIDDDLETAQAAIIEHQLDDGTMWELVDAEGRSRGMFKDVQSAVQAGEREFEAPEVAPPAEAPPVLVGGPRVAPKRTTPPEKAPPAPGYKEFIRPGGIEEDYARMALDELPARDYKTLDQAREWLNKTKNQAQAYVTELEQKGVTGRPELRYDFFKAKVDYFDGLLNNLLKIARRDFPKEMGIKAPAPARPELVGGPRVAPVRTVPSTPPPATLPEAPAATVTPSPGNANTAIITPQNPEGHPAEYALIEADDLTPSHNPETFQKNADYPEGIQERAYHSDKAEQAKVITNANRLDPRILLSDDPTPTSGPPIIDQNNLVISGNSRTMSIQRAFADDKKTAKYKNQLIMQASKFGLAPKDIKAMKKPVMVRRMLVENDDMMRALAREFNETMTQGLGEAAETASMGKAITPATMEKIGNRITEREISLRELLGKKDGPEILQWLVDDGALSRTQANVYLNKEGDLLNKRGKETIEAAIFGNIIDDLDLINSAQKAHKNKIERSLAELARVKARGEQWDITEDLKEGLRLATAAQAQDLSIRDLLAQQPLFGDAPQYSETAKGLADLLMKDKPTQHKERWRGYATDATADTKKQVQMFKPKTQPESLLEHFGIETAPPAAPAEVEAPAEAPPAEAPPEAPAAITAPIKPFKEQRGGAEKYIGKLLNDMGIQEAIMQGEDYYRKVKNPPYMDLVIERHLHQDYNRPERDPVQAIILTHYYEQAGDLIMDTEMVLEVGPEGHLKLIETATQNPRTGGELRGLDKGFGNMFAKNLNAQGFGGVPIAEPAPTARPTEAAPPAPAVPAAKPAPTHEKATGSANLGRWLRDRLAAGKATSWKQLFNAADRNFGGTQAEGVYSPKDAYDAMELGVNQFLLSGDSGLFINAKGERLTPEQNIARLKEILELIPTQTKRTREQGEFQQFSTPPPLAYVANWVANIGKNDVYLEPSAGVGGLAIFGRMSDAAGVVVNELDTRRAALLGEIGFPAVYVEDASQLNNILPKDVKPTVIVMNPPFSATAGRIKGIRATKYGAQQIEQALARLEDGGRLVGIVGKGMGDQEPGFKSWWRKIKRDHTVLANVRVSGQEYRKYGTTYDNQLIIIDKIGPTDYNLVRGKVDKIEDLIPLLEGVRNDRQTVARPGEERKPPTGEPPRVEVPETERPAAEQPEPMGPAIPGVGPGLRPGELERPTGAKPGEPTELAAPTGEQLPGAERPIGEEPGQERPGVAPGEPARPSPIGEREGVSELSPDELESLIDEVIAEEDLTAPDRPKKAAPKKAPTTGKAAPKTAKGSYAAIANIIGTIKEPTTAYKTPVKVEDLDAITSTWAGEINHYGKEKAQGVRGILRQLIEPLSQIKDSDPIEMNVPGLDQDIFFDNEADAREFLQAYDYVLDDYLAFGDLLRAEGAPRSLQSFDNLITKIFPKKPLIPTTPEVRAQAAAYETLLMHPQAYEQAKPLFEQTYREFAGNPKEWIRDALRNLSAYKIDLDIAKNWIMYYYANDRPDLAAAPTKLDLIQKRKKIAKEIKASLYENYQTSVGVKGANPHPTPLVETAALADTNLPELTYTPDLPESILKPKKKGAGISDVQLEFVAYAGQAHESELPDGSRKGAMAGHGTGVGKGRIIASVMLDNWRKGRKKAIWISEKQDLINDASRDLVEMGWSDGAKALVNLNKAAKTGKRIGKKHRDNTILYTTYATLSSNFKAFQKEHGIRIDEADPAKADTQAALKDMKIRINQILDWAGPDYDGVIAFDESHNMANSMQSKGKMGKTQVADKAIAGVLLQKLLPKARVIYVSATGATEVKNFAYAERLGLWGEGTAFAGKEQFIGEIEGAGLATMEMIARDLKARGQYMAPSLSYDGVEYDRVEHKLTEDQREVYDAIARAWQIIMQNTEAALQITGAVMDGSAKRAARSALFGTQVRAFNQIMTGMQMPAVLDAIEADIARGESVVIQLTQTNDAATQRALESRQEGEDLEDLDTTPRRAIAEYLERAFPTQQYQEVMDEDGNVRMEAVYDSEGNPVENAEAVAMRDQMLRELGALKIPDNPLDQLFNAFGADKIAEITGRKSRLIKDPDTGELVNQKWSDAKSMADKEAFLNGDKQILIFSEKGGTGSSYHADTRFKNQTKRNHYLLQPGWKAPTAIQGLGRTHRSNQKQPPKYILVTTDLKAQKRFITTIARRLDQLGALTKGQRQAGSQGIFQARDNLESDYAAEALHRFYEQMVDGKLDITAKEFEDATGLYIVDDKGKLVKQTPEITQTLNRMLSMEIDMQNEVFGQFSDNLDAILQEHAEAGTLDVGVETIQALAAEKKSEKVVFTDPESNAETKYIRVTITNPSRRIPFEDVSHLNFYQNIKSDRLWAAGETRDRTLRSGAIVQYRRMQSPNDTINRVNEDDLNNAEKWRKLDKKEAARLWETEYAKIPETSDTDIHLITGALLGIWDRLPKGASTVYRLQTDDGERLLGRVIHPNVLEQTLENLGVTAEKIEVESKALGGKILGGGRVSLANGWEFKKSLVSGEERIELIGPDSRDLDLLEKQGAFVEVINYKTRIFIPTKDNAGIFDRILLNRPITKIQTAYQGPRIADTALSETSTEFAKNIHAKIKAGRKVTQMDLFETTEAGVNLPGPAQLVEVRSTGTMDFESHVIANAQDAAAFAAPLADLAQEKGFMISTDDKGNIKEVHFLSKGTRQATTIGIVETVGRLFNTPGVTKAYFIHNHPSGQLARETSPSPEDRHIALGMRELAATGGVEIDNIVIAGDRYLHFNPAGTAPGLISEGKIRKTTRKVKVPVVERFVKPTGRPTKVIDNSNKAREHLETVYDNRNGFLFLNTKMQDLGFMEFVPGTPASQLVRDIISEAERVNASVFLFNSVSDSEELPADRANFLNEWQKQLGGGVLQLMEILHNGKSFADYGRIGQPDYKGNLDNLLSDRPVFAAKTIAPTTPLTVDEVKIMRDAVTANWARPGPAIKIYRTQQGLPNDVKAYLKKEGRDNQLIAGAYLDNTIYLVAENLGSNEEVLTTILHEGFGHHGLRGILGKDIFPTLRDLYIAKKSEVEALGRELGIDTKTEAGRAEAAEEWFARQAQLGIESKWYDRIVRAIRAWIRRLGISIKVSDPEIRALIAGARQYTLSGRRITATPGERPAFATAKKKGEDIKYDDILSPEVQKRMAAARGVAGKGPLLQRMKEGIRKARAERQHFPALQKIEDKTLRFKLADILRLHQEIPETARSVAAEQIRDWIKNLSTDGYEVYTTNIVLADMMRDIESGLLNDAMLAEGETLPFGFKSTDEVREAYGRFQALAERHDEIKKALDARRDYIDKMVRELVKHKILKKEVLNHKDYYHHQVLKYWGTKDEGKGLMTGSADVRKHWRPWQTARKGSLLDYNTEYVEAEFTALSQQLGQLETARTLARIKKEADIYADLKDEAKRQNLINFYEKEAKALSKMFGTTITAAEVRADSKLDPLAGYKQAIAMSMSALERMAGEGKIEGDSEFDDIVEQLREQAQMRKEDPELMADVPRGIPDARFFDWLAYLVRTGQPGSSWAATIFKNIQGRNRHIKEGLGKDFLTFRQLIPEGYTEWKPEPGKTMFWANTMADNVIQQVIAGERDLREEDVRQVLAKGRDIIWVLPEGLAETMEKFKDPPSNYWMGRVSATTLRMWKQYILINPVRVLKYNINNMSGDMDIVIAYNPKILKGMKKALSDLRAWNKGNASGSIKKELDLARRLGVIGSGWSVQEVDEITKQMGTDKFVRQVIQGESPNIAARYWQAAKNATATRENILRLASFRHFQSEIAKGKSVYGASKYDEIDAIADPTEKAAKLARELVGDYGNISHSGQWIRKRLMPFYSWIEINAPRYAYMLRNVRYEGREIGARPLKMVGIKALTKTAGFGTKALALYALVQIWNNLLFPDEEEEFGKAGRRQLHLILGRREDGSIRSIRFQGALSDALSFFGLEDWPEDAKEVISGQKTVLEKLKEVPKAFVTRFFHALRPEPKLLYETVAQESFYPDPWTPRPIRDNIEHIVRLFSLDALYRRLAGKPGRGKTMAEHFFNDLQNVVIYNSDPGEQSYYDVRRMVYDWMEKEGIEKPSGKPTNRGNALYYYRQALKYGDFNAAERYLKKYYELGGTPTGLKTSIKAAHPLTGIKKVDRYKFRKNLSAADQATLDRAMEWYKKTYLSGEYRKMRFRVRREYLKEKAASR